MCIVVILNREIGGGDDARGASKVGITHAGCREEMKGKHLSLDYIRFPSPLLLPARRAWSLYSPIPDITTSYFLPQFSAASKESQIPVTLVEGQAYKSSPAAL